jgi:predicted amidophosphoribosyltransferase
MRALLDLVFPSACAGCDEPAAGAQICEPCRAALFAAEPQRVRPDPEPEGLPRTYALAAYDGVLREMLLQYKERGRHGLADPLGDLLATVVRRGERTSAPALLVPVPATAKAIRERHGDHMVRLANRVARTLRRGGRPAAVACGLSALPRQDSTELSALERIRTASLGFTTRPSAVPAMREAAERGAAVILVDDIVTTGATLAATAERLEAAGVPVTCAGALAATQRHSTGMRV